ncbi:MAG: thiol-disulfide oxidoreductase DCC family protein [Bacteroidota bacterium]
MSPANDLVTNGHATSAPVAPSPTTLAALPAAEVLRQHPVILFDGVCNLCNASVNFVLDRDRASLFRMAALQSDVGQALLAQHGYAGTAPDSIALVEDGQIHFRSTAALRIAARLDGAWPLFQVFRVVPEPLRDVVYDWIARNRYRWFGKQDACRLPTPDERARFLDYQVPA